MKTKSNMDRRTFLGSVSTLAVGAPFILKAKNQKKSASRVIEVHCPGVLTGRTIDQDKLRLMVGAGLSTLADTGLQLKDMIRPTDRVGLKINCLGRPLLYTHHELIQAFAEELQKIGVHENNIIVWDRYDSHMAACGFEFNTSDTGIRCYATEGSENSRFDADASYVSEFDNLRRGSGGTVSRISSIFTQDCDKIINLAILKDHGISGVTLALKNLAYGLCDNNARFHGREHIGTFIADFCAIQSVREKVVLHVVDGIEGCFDQGPRPGTEKTIFSPESIWISTDPVALDTVGLDIIDRKRVSMGLPRLAEEGRAVNHIPFAAKKGLGEQRLSEIKIDRVRIGHG